MQNFLTDYYLWILSFHIISVMFWMAGLYYLPRLFVYHLEARAADEPQARFETMEAKLLTIIMRPALIAAWIFGLLLVAHFVSSSGWQSWLVAKLALVILLSGYHGFLSASHKRLKAGAPYKSARFFRLINEIPPLLTIVIVLLVIFKPS